MINSVNFLLADTFIRFDASTGRRNSYGYKLCLFNRRFVLYRYEFKCMAKLENDPSIKSHMLDKFNNTYHYLDDIFSLNNPDFYKYNTEIYQMELTLNKPTLTVSIVYFCI